MSISTDDIFNKIYGSSATQETISLRGGKRCYLDENPLRKQYNVRSNKAQQTKQLTRKAVKNNDVIIYADPAHFPDNRFKEYIEKLYLDYYTSRSSPNTIYIIPSDKTLKEIYSTLKSLTKNTVKGSAEERKIIMENAEKLLYKRYIFSKYGDNRKDQNYKIGPNDDIDNEYPNKEFNLLRRINIANEIYYLSYDSPQKINISVNADMKDAVKLNYIGRCAHGVYIFNGDLPKESPEIYVDKYEKHNVMVGGGKSYISALNSFMNSYNNKDIAMQSFILKRYAKDSNLVKKYINADKIYTFFGIISNDIANKVKFNDAISKVNNPEEIEHEIEQYSANNLIENMSSRIISAFDKLSHKNNYKCKDLEKLYKNKDETVIRADVMTALYHNGINNINELLSMTDNFADNQIYDELITQAYHAYPMTSNTGRAYCYLSNGNYHKEEQIINQNKQEEIIPENKNIVDEKNINQMKNNTKDDFNLEDFY